MCVCGWCTAACLTTATCSRPMQGPNTHRRAYTNYTKHTAAANAVAHTHHWNACSSFRLATPPRYQISLIPKGKFVYPCKIFIAFFARCSPAAEGFLSYVRLRGNQGGRRYITTHAWIPAKLRGGALSIQRRLVHFAKGLFSASLRRAGGCMEHPHNFRYI